MIFTFKQFREIARQESLHMILCVIQANYSFLSLARSFLFTYFEGGF
ncbi:hypothetical protein [Paraclostridium sordellii]|nr:hypothetical protein [Paeniclostridium sordellii]